MTQYVITVKLGEDYYEALKVYADDISEAISEGCNALDCSSSDIVSIVKVS